jgi:DmsE family decaheme c-type cytochrome
MRNLGGRLLALMAVGSLVLCAGAFAQANAPGAAAAASSAAPAAPASAAARAPLPPRGAYSEKGADTCLECHDDVTSDYSSAAIFKGKHAHRNDARTPFGPGGLQCEACHGPGARHARSKNPDAINSLKAGSTQSAEERNQPCLTCHESGARIGWHASAHERSGVACADCHRMHQDRDPVLAKASEADVCFTCHRQKRAEFLKPSTHPVRSGQMSCSDCHSPHAATSSTAMLVKPTLNQTCYSCHADKRGPLLWEHAPVSEDCSLCHSPHGSVRNALLTKTPPLLCQQCHAPADHPSVARTSQSLPGGGAGGSIFLAAGGCTNCHSRVHGSNHPAGARLMR